MATRNFRIYAPSTFGIQSVDGSATSAAVVGTDPKVLVESAANEQFLLLQNGGIISLDKQLGNDLKNMYQKITDGFAILGILRLSEGDNYLLLVTGILSVGQLFSSDIYKITSVKFVSLRSATQTENGDAFDARIYELQKLFSAGIFYYSNSQSSSLDRQNPFNLTVSLQQQKTRANNVGPDPRFFWNRNLSFPFERFGINASDWIVSCIAGSVLVRNIYVGHRIAKVALISRLSCEHVGTRFNVRGINDDGNVANFVETEQLVVFENQATSFLQIRGSVPLFWEQPGINVGAHIIKIRPLELSLLAFERHLIQLKQFYGSVLCINLLGSKKGEAILSNAFQTAIKTSAHTDVQLVSFDYHAEVKLSKESLKVLIKQIASFIEQCKFFYQNDESILSRQTGAIRTNCMDCLDRTNSVQTLIGMNALVAQLLKLDLEKYKANIIARFEDVIREMWQKNGDQCSVIYAGTGALEGKSKIKDASRSIVRTIQNNLMDLAKQEAFDLLLYGSLYGNRQFDKLCNLLPSTFLRASSYFFECPNLDAFVEREREMCEQVPLRIFAGTWNVNGGKNMYNVAFKHQDKLSSWIFPTELLDCHSLNYDLIAVGFEEIVDLNAGNIVKASTTNQRVWRDGLKQTIREFQHANFGAKAENFVVVCCEQLVGVCLVLFVRSSLLRSVRDVALDEVKTGMGGATGNKGSIAVRMTVNGTSVCFVCSHFAAGQNEVTARNADFHTTLRRIRFPMGRTIDQHDVVFWFGDFNYRISTLTGDDVKGAVRTNNFAFLSEHDQLSQQRELGNVFAGFNEGPLHFAPTYKYDTFSDDYDTSEKCRAPAWTDRVLWMDQGSGGGAAGGNLVRLIHYGRSELKTSDHRPVFAIFQVTSLKFDFPQAEPVLRDIVHSIGPPNSTIRCSCVSQPQFPKALCNDVFTRLYELGATVLVSKLEHQFLYIVLGAGIDALVALSLDGISLTSDDGTPQQLHVSLCDTDQQQQQQCWPDHVLTNMDGALERAKREESALRETTFAATNTNGENAVVVDEAGNVEDVADLLLDLDDMEEIAAFEE